MALLAVAFAAPAAPRLTVDASNKPGEAWKAYPTRTLDDLPAAVIARTNSALSCYGGLLAQKTKATGFFYPARIEGKWWLVDPEGCLFLHNGVASVRMADTAASRDACKEQFGSQTNWPHRTAALLHDHGFNGLGAWSDVERLRKASPPLVYTRTWSFMSSYGKKRGGTFQQPGHTGYPHDCIFVFDPQFESFCDQYARALAADKYDPWLLGHFSDNEMPLNRTALQNYLELPDRDPGRQAALAWLRARHGDQAAAPDITEKDEQEFLALVVERYFRAVSAAIKKHDPNHLYLGARFHGAVPRLPEVFRAAGPYVDVVSVNLYHVWTPDLSRLAMWERESGKPFLITEWYAKAVDSGLPNQTGAGWLVKTQQDRGRFYQNFALALLQAKGCVGWHWFKYIDNDPAATGADPSNQDANKGIVNNRYVPYTTLLDAMKPLNQRIFSLAEYFSSPPVATGGGARGQ
jgi:hypothetical protein